MYSNLLVSAAEFNLDAVLENCLGKPKLASFND